MKTKAFILAITLQVGCVFGINTKSLYFYSNDSQDNNWVGSASVSWPADYASDNLTTPPQNDSIEKYIIQFPFEGNTPDNQTVYNELEAQHFITENQANNTLGLPNGSTFNFLYMGTLSFTPTSGDYIGQQIDCNNLAIIQATTKPRLITYYPWVIVTNANQPENNVFNTWNDSDQIIIPCALDAEPKTPVTVTVSKYYFAGAENRIILQTSDSISN